jgi:hypothetical protein
MFQELTGIEICHDYFICDECNEKLFSSVKFKKDCLQNFENQNQTSFQSENTNKCVHRTRYSVKAEYKQENSNPSESVEAIFVNTEDSKLEESTLDQLSSDSDEDNEGFYKEETEQESKGQEVVFELDNPDELQTNKLYLNPQTGKMELVKKRKLKGLEPETRKSYTAKTKIEIIKYAELKGNREASRQYNINESSIRGWRKQKDKLMLMESDRRTFRKGSPYWPELEKQLAVWVENERNLGKNITSFHIKIEALKMARQRNINNFRYILFNSLRSHSLIFILSSSGTKKWCYSFMKRNGIAARSRKKKTDEKMKLLNPMAISISQG